MSKKFVILSIDGGGLRGIVPVKILQHIEGITGKKIIDSFDLFAGTSTGGLITCGLTLGGTGTSYTRYDLDFLEYIYTEKGKEIFPDRNKASKFYHNWIKGIWKPEFNGKGLGKVLGELFNDLDKESGFNARIGHCVKPIFVTTYDIKSNQPLFFKSRHAAQNHKENACLYDVCRATSAGPTYLPAYEFVINDKKVTCLDGGVFMNNPSMGALVEIWKYKDDPYYGLSDLKDEDIYLLSVGTGHSTAQVIENGAAVKWGGKKNWVTAINEIMIYGPNQATDYQAGESLNFPKLNRKNYLRIQIDIDDGRSVMTDSSDETREYLIREVRNQFVNNDTLQKNLNRFLADAGIL